MIKINLALRKQSSAAIAEAGAGGGATATFTRFTRMTRTEALGALKELPIKRLVVWAVIAAGAYYVQTARKEEDLAKVDVSLNKATSEQSKLKSELAKTKGFEAIKKQLDADEMVMRTKIETITRLVNDRQSFPKIFITLSSGMPNDVWISELTMVNDEVRMKGHSLGFGEISDFIKNLAESAYFEEPRLINTEKEKDDTGAEAARFELATKRR